MAGNPRIDDLRKRLERDPGSRLFAQLAEELRKDGDFEEAINVCREGLKRQPAYPSARMTLGRALFDTGDVAAARAEFETVLKGAPDNILASRLLAECLEGLGDLPAAVRQYKTTLALAPGDKQVQAHLDAVEKKMKAGPSAPPPASSVAPTVRMPPPPAAATILMPPPPAPPPPAVRPQPVADTSPDRYPQPEPEPEAPPPPRLPDRDFAPIKLVAADETFELEAAHESTPTKVGGGGASAVGGDWVVGIAMPMPPPPAAPSPAPEADFTAPLARPAYAPAEPSFPMPEEPPTIEKPPPAPVAQADEGFEIERPYERVAPAWPPPPPTPAAAPAAPEPDVEEPIVEEPIVEEPPPTVEQRRADFSEEFTPPAPEPPRLPPLPMEPEPEPEPAPKPRPETVSFASPAPAPPVVHAPPPAEVPAAAPPTPAPPTAAAAPAEADLSSSTLAELYFNQGFTEKALAVYRQLLQREPGNERARARVAEIEGLERHLREEEARAAETDRAPGRDPAAARRRAIERTIARLEGLLAAIKKGGA